jgi:hypothetical protein
MTNGAMKIAPFGGGFAGRKGVFLQLQRRLDKHHIGNITPVLAYVPMHIELSHIDGSKRRIIISE